MGLHKRRNVFTYAEYRNWKDDERWEIIDGEAFAMTQQKLIEFGACRLCIHYIYY